jgi:hypothetical protein
MHPKEQAATADILQHLVRAVGNDIAMGLTVRESVHRAF